MTSRPPTKPMEMPIRLLGVALLLAVVAADAQVYKGIGADGRPFYSDRPIPDAAPIVLPGLTTGTEPTPPVASAPGDHRLGFRGSYDEFEMVTPEDGVMIRDAEGRLEISLVLAPPLLDGHRVSIEVDGVAASGDVTGSQVELSGLPYGSHAVQALVFDPAGVPVAATNTVTVHVRPPVPEERLP